MKSLGCPKQPYILWEAQGSELPLSVVERLTGFVLGGTALLPPCPAWEGSLEQVPSQDIPGTATLLWMESKGVDDAACQLAFEVHVGPQEEPGTARSKICIGLTQPV